MAFVIGMCTEVIEKFDCSGLVPGRFRDRRVPHRCWKVVSTLLVTGFLVLVLLVRCQRAAGLGSTDISRRLRLHLRSMAILQATPNWYNRVKFQVTMLHQHNESAITPRGTRPHVARSETVQDWHLRTSHITLCLCSHVSVLASLECHRAVHALVL